MAEDPSFQLETWDFKACCHTSAIWQNKHSNEISSLPAGTNAVVATLSRVNVTSSQVQYAAVDTLKVAGSPSNREVAVTKSPDMKL